MNLDTLETIKINTLLNLSSVHLKKKSYKDSIEFSKQVSLIYLKMFTIKCNDQQNFNPIHKVQTIFCSTKLVLDLFISIYLAE